MIDLLILMTVATADTTRYSVVGLYRHLKERLGDAFNMTEEEYNLLVIKLMEAGELNCTDMSLSLGIHGKVRLCNNDLMHFILEHMTPLKEEVDRLAKLRAAERR